MADITDIDTQTITTIGVFLKGTAIGATWQYFCGLNARSFNRTRDRKQDSYPMECGPGAPLEVVSTAGALDWQITGGAIMELDTFLFLNTWMETGGGDSQPIRVVFYKGAKKSLTAVGYIEGTGILTSLGVGQGDADGNTTADVTIQKAGPSHWTAGVPA